MSIPQANSLWSYIERMVDEWPPLNLDQRARLAELLTVGRLAAENASATPVDDGRDADA